MRDKANVWLGVFIMVVSSAIFTGSTKAAALNKLPHEQIQESDATHKVAFLISKERKLNKYAKLHRLKDGQLIDLLRTVGFKGKGLRTACAIAKAESNGRPLAFNGNVKTGDSSYGVFQINMIGGLGPERRDKFNLRSNTQLWNPVINAQVALHMSKKGKDWSSWSSAGGKRYHEWYNKYPCKPTI